MTKREPETCLAGLHRASDKLSSGILHVSAEELAILLASPSAKVVRDVKKGDKHAMVVEHRHRLFLNVTKEKK